MSSTTVDFATPTGAVKPLHGLNNGPVGFGAVLDNSHRFRELGVPWARLHDTNWPHPREVDVPQKTFYAFKAFRELLAYPERVAASCNTPDVDVLAARTADSREGAVLIANFGAHEGKVSIRLDGLPGTAAGVEICLVDRDHNLEPLTAAGSGVNAFVAGQDHLKQDQALAGTAAGTIEVMLRRHAVCLVRTGVRRPQRQV